MLVVCCLISSSVEWVWGSATDGIVHGLAENMSPLSSRTPYEVGAAAFGKCFLSSDLSIGRVSRGGQ